MVDCYSKMPFARRIPSSQCNAAKTISVLRGCSLSMVSLRPSDLKMDHNLPAINLLSLLRSGVLITPQVHLGTQGVMAKLKLLSRLQKVSSPVPNTQGRIPTLPCWHTGAHPLMLTFVQQQRCSTREQQEPLCPKGSGTRTPKLQLTEITSMTMPPRVLHTMIVTADKSPHYMQDKLSLYSITPRPSGSQLQSSIKPDMAPTWFKSLVEASTDMHMITSMNVTQMLSSQTCLSALM